MEWKCQGMGLKFETSIPTFHICSDYFYVKSEQIKKFSIHKIFYRCLQIDMMNDDIEKVSVG